jgi:hypothetical protein
MAVTPHDSTGTVLTWAGTTYTVTNIVITNENPAADDNIDVSHLGLTAGASVATISRPLTGTTSDTGRSVQFDYLGKSVIADASTGTMTVTSGGTTLLNAVAGTVQSSTLTLATNDAIRGQATVRIARS